MNRSDELREQIDACRTGSDDLHLPELAELATTLEQDRAVAAQYDRSQQFDRQVISALHDVPVPTGLLERLLERTSAASTTSAEPGADDQAIVEPAFVASAHSSASRRAWLWQAGAVTALAAAVILALTAWLAQQPRTFTQEQLVADVPAWVAEVNSPAQWNQDSRARASYPLDLALHTHPVAWRQYQLPAGDPAVVYDVSPPGQAKVLLFVINARNKYIVAAAPGAPLPGTTGGIQIVAWQRPGGPLYVLVVGQGGSRLGDYLRIPRAT